MHDIGIGYNKITGALILSVVFHTLKEIRTHWMDIFLFPVTAFFLAYVLLSNLNPLQFAASASVAVVNSWGGEIGNIQTSEQLLEALNTASENASRLEGILENRSFQGAVAQEVGLEQFQGELSAVQSGDSNIVQITVRADSPYLAYTELKAALDRCSAVAAEIGGGLDVSVLEHPQVPERREHPLRNLKFAASLGLLLMSVSTIAAIVFSCMNSSIQAVEGKDTKDGRLTHPYKLEVDVVWILFDIKKKLLSHWKRFAAILAIAGISSFLCAKAVYHPYYECYSVFTVNIDGAAGPNTMGQTNAIAAKAGKVFCSVLTSDALRSLTARELGYEAGEDFKALILASCINGTNLVTLRTRADAPQEAYDVLQAVLKQYPLVCEPVMGDVDLKVQYGSGSVTDPANNSGEWEAAVKGILGSGLLLLICLILHSVLKDTVRTQEDLLRLSNQMWTCTLPSAYRKRNIASRGTSVMIDQGVVSDGFRNGIILLCNRLKDIKQEEGSNTFFVTSARPFEGKTTVSRNMSLALSANKDSVLLLDCSRFLNSVEDEKTGSRGSAISSDDNYISERELNQIVKPWRDGVDLLTVTDEFMESSLFLKRGIMLADLVSTLERLYDYIIIDSPCLKSMISLGDKEPDAATNGNSKAAPGTEFIEIEGDTYPKAADSVSISSILKAADGCIFVIRQDYSSAGMVEECLETLHKRGCPCIGCVLNEAD